MPAPSVQISGRLVQAGDKVVYIALDGTRRKAYFRGIYEEYLAPHSCPGCRCPRLPHELNGALRIRLHGDRHDSLVSRNSVRPWDEEPKGGDDESR